MDLMADQRERTVTAADGRRVLIDPRQHREQVIRRLLATGISVATLRAIVPEWSVLLTCLDAEVHAHETPVLTAG